MLVLARGSAVLLLCAMGGAAVELHATIEPYPGYAGEFLGTTGSVMVTSEADDELTLQYHLSSKDSAGGLHIHEGETCAESGGHFWTPASAPDPWIPAVTEGNLVSVPACVCVRACVFLCKLR
eukprot:SAG31_NODE_272_length_18690_cov_14.520785_14_plen_123_part_00